MEALRGEHSDEDKNADEPGRCRVTKPCEDEVDHNIEQRGTETDEEGFMKPVQELGTPPARVSDSLEAQPVAELQFNPTPGIVVAINCPPNHDSRCSNRP